MKTTHLIFLVSVFALMLLLLEQPNNKLKPLSLPTEVSTNLTLPVGHTNVVK